MLSRARRGGRLALETLIAQLEAEKAKEKIYFEQRPDEQGHIAILFLADMRSVEYLNQYSNILLLDYTYKTNKFNMLLLDILRVNNHNYRFSISVCFLDSEVEDNYKEAIQHLCVLF